MKAWQVASPPTRSYELTLTVRPKYERLNIWLPCPWLHSAGPPVQRSWSQPPWWSHQSRPQTYPLVPSSCSAGSAAPDAGKTRREACDWSVSEAEACFITISFTWAFLELGCAYLCCSARVRVWQKTWHATFCVAERGTLPAFKHLALLPISALLENIITDRRRTDGRERDTNAQQLTASSAFSPLLILCTSFSNSDKLQKKERQIWRQILLAVYLCVSQLTLSVAFYQEFPQHVKNHKQFYSSYSWHGPTVTTCSQREKCSFPSSEILHTYLTLAASGTLPRSCWMWSVSG